jgi:hypothetical protein
MLLSVCVCVHTCVYVWSVPVCVGWGKIRIVGINGREGCYDLNVFPK